MAIQVDAQRRRGSIGAGMFMAVALVALAMSPVAAHSAPSSPVVAPSVGQACPFSDQFTGKTINQRWTKSSPNPDSRERLTGTGWLLLKASPNNGGSDLWSGSNYLAPLILQRVGTGRDWTITTQLRFDPTNIAQGAGILLATRAGGFTNDSQFVRIVERGYYDGLGNTLGMGDFLGDATKRVAYSKTVVYVKLVKRGTSYTAFYRSSEAAAWKKLGQLTLSTKWNWIGLHSIRQPWDGDTTVYSSASFNFFVVKATGCS